VISTKALEGYESEPGLLRPGPFHALRASEFRRVVFSGEESMDRDQGTPRSCHAPLLNLWKVGRSGPYDEPEVIVAVSETSRLRRAR
jgi:hypothetical protein